MVRPWTKTQTKKSKKNVGSTSAYLSSVLTTTTTPTLACRDISSACCPCILEVTKHLLGGFPICMSVIIEQQRFYALFLVTQQACYQATMIAPVPHHQNGLQKRLLPSLQAIAMTPYRPLTTSSIYIELKACKPESIILMCNLCVFTTSGVALRTETPVEATPEVASETVKMTYRSSAP